MLEVTSLSKQFGGLRANADVSLQVRVGQVHVVIGPNGAGKSTLINMLSGDLVPSAGSIRLDGQEIAGWPADRISRMGVGRSYQKTNIFSSFTVLENCRLAAQSRAPHAWRLFAPADSDQASLALARRAISQAELDGREERIASTLSHGEQRQLEIALSLATAPRLLLLDEPLAGMGAEESMRMVALIEKLKGQPDIKECFIPLMKLDVASNVLLKHLGYKWVGESIGTVKDKVYYSQVSWRTFFG